MRAQVATLAGPDAAAGAGTGTTQRRWLRRVATALCLLAIAEGLAELVAAAATGSSTNLGR